MKYRIYLIGLALLFPGDIFAQTAPPPAYFQLVKKADTLFQEQEYQRSASTYSAAFSKFNGRAILNDRYNAACAWAKSGKPDSAFFHLFKVANAGKYADDQHLAIDSDLVSIHKDTRWADLMTTVRNNKTALEAQYNQPVKKELENIFRIRPILPPQSRQRSEQIRFQINPNAVVVRQHENTGQD